MGGAPLPMRTAVHLGPGFGVAARTIRANAPLASAADAPRAAVSIRVAPSVKVRALASKAETAPRSENGVAALLRSTRVATWRPEAA